MMNKLTLLFALFIGALSSCKKEEADIEKPVISLDEPLENFVVNLGAAFDFQGIIYDNKELGTLYMEIASPAASYDFHYLDSIELTGTSYDFHDWIIIPVNAAVGVGEFKVYGRDASGNQSHIISRTMQMRDKIDPVIEIESTLVEDADSIIFTLYANEHDVYDSLTVYNYTKSAQLLTMSDVGGFKDLFISRDVSAGGEASQFEAHDLTTLITPVYQINFTVDLDDTFTEYYLHAPYLKITIVEYRTPIDVDTYGAAADNGHHSAQFVVVP
jgi:hypothetical protein